LTIVEDQRPQRAGNPTAGGELHLHVKSEAFGEFVPTAFRQDPQVSLSYLDPLIWVDEVTLEPKPWLARSWKWADDGLSLSVELRDDVTWHDGSPLTAEDVAFALLCYRDDYDSAVSFMLSVVADIEVTSEISLKVTFDEPDGTFPYNACNLPIFSRAQYEEHWTAKPVGERTLGGFEIGDAAPLGTGPWKIESRSDNEMELVPNRDHFAVVPYADRLVLTVEDDADASLKEWRAGDIQLTWPLDGTKVESLRYDEGSLVVADATISHFAAYNFGNPTRVDPGWMASPGLREALAQVIDRERYATSVFGGFVDVDRAGFMTQPWAIDTKVRNPKRDVGAARKLLADNGWTDWDGDGVLDSPSGDRGALVCIVREDADPQLLAILDSIADDFAGIGLQLEVQRLSTEEFTTRWTSTFDYDLIAITLNQYAAFSEFDLVGSAWSIRRNAAGWNPGGYWNAELDEAILSYLSSWKQDEMKTALTTIQRLSNDDPFALWLGFPKQLVLLQPHVSGFQPNKMWQSWNTWSLWQGEEASIVTPIPATPVPATPIPATPVPATPSASPVVSPAVASPDTDD
jgi:peptide/nickel transport system substrate-binding protein